MNHQLAVRLLTMALLCGFATSEFLGDWGNDRLAYGLDVYHPSLGRAHQATQGELTADHPYPAPLVNSAPYPLPHPLPPLSRLGKLDDGMHHPAPVVRQMGRKQTANSQRSNSHRNGVVAFDSGNTSPIEVQGRQDDRDAKSMADSRQATIQAWIKQLGADEFREREAATAALTRVGIPAMEPLERVLDHPDREVRDRATRILATIQKVHLERRLEQFLRGELLSSEAELPGWSRYRELVGDGDITRQYFVELQKHEYRLLAVLNDDPAEIAKTVAQRTAQLDASYRDPNERLEETSIAALLLLAGAPEVKVDDVTFVSLYYLCNNVGFYDAVKQGRQRATLQRLMAPWLTKAEWGTAYQALVLGLRYDVPEVMSIAKTILADRQNAATHVQRYAIEAVAKFGGKPELATLAPLLDDDTRLHARQIDGRSFETQMRDLALVASVYLVGLKPADFGFKHVAYHEEFVFVDSSVGFESEAQRAAAFKEWQSAKQKWETSDEEPATKNQ